MHTELPARMLGNMSAPPRSVVTLPRLPVPGTAPAEAANEPASDAETGAAGGVPVGPGGGLLQSGALRIARIRLGTALDAATAPGIAEILLARPLELVRQLVVLARRQQGAEGAGDPFGSAGTALPPPMRMEEGAAVDELVRRFGAMPWPDWVPTVGFIVAGSPEAEEESGASGRTPVPVGVACPLLAARLITRMRGPVFLRDAAPAFARLLAPSERDAAYAIHDLWLPIRPGRARPAPCPIERPEGETR